MRIIQYSLAAALAVGAFACSAQDGAVAIEDETVAEGALGEAATNLTGKYESDGEPLYAATLSLQADGKFSGRLHRKMFGKRCPATGDCTSPASGAWNISATDRLVLRVDELDADRLPTAKTISFDYSYSESGSRPRLTIDRVRESQGIQGLLGLEDSSAEGPCANKQCGDSCRLCEGRVGCRETAVPKVCNARGQCRSQMPTCN